LIVPRTFIVRQPTPHYASTGHIVTHINKFAEPYVHIQHKASGFGQHLFYVAKSEFEYRFSMMGCRFSSISWQVLFLGVAESIGISRRM
jgi:hypothetical protein